MYSGGRTFLTGPRVFLSRSPTSSSNRARVSGSLRSTPSARLSISTRTCGTQGQGSRSELQAKDDIRYDDFKVTLALCCGGPAQQTRG